VWRARRWPPDTATFAGDLPADKKNIKRTPRERGVLFIYALNLIMPLEPMAYLADRAVDHHNHEQ